MPETDVNTQPFFFPGGEPGVLLVHGYLTSPKEMRPLGEYLAASGMTVSGICLRGHGTRPEDLVDIPWLAWAEDVRQGLERLRGECERVCVAGLSLGAALVLYAAAREPVARVVAFSAPDSVLARHSPLRFARFLSRWITFLPKVGSDIRDSEVRRQRFTYNRIPLWNAAQVYAFLCALDAQIPRVTVPTLLVNARHDRVIPSRATRRIASSLRCPRRVVWLERGGHTVVLDYAREAAWQAAREWFQADSLNGSLSTERA